MYNFTIKIKGREETTHILNNEQKEIMNWMVVSSSDFTYIPADLPTINFILFAMCKCALMFLMHMSSYVYAYHHIFL